MSEERGYVNREKGLASSVRLGNRGLSQEKDFPYLIFRFSFFIRVKLERSETRRKSTLYLDLYCKPAINLNDLPGDVARVVG